MQNKPNFRKPKMNLSLHSTKDYENEPRLQKPKNKPNQTQFYPPQADKYGGQSIRLAGNQGSRHQFIRKSGERRKKNFAACGKCKKK
jgi:hypothetical protein